MNELRVGFAGLGAMGAPMARNIHDAGLLEAVWNRTGNRAKALARELAVAHSAGLSELAASCNVVVVCVSADDDVREVCAGLRSGLQPGDVVIDMSTVGAATARDVAASLGADGVGFLDAPVSGGVEGARAGSLSVMVGGDERHLRRVRPVLEAMAGRITHMGPVGAGQSTKAVNQVMVAGIAEAVCEALAFAEALNLQGEQVVDVLAAGAAGNWFLDHRGRTMLEDHFAPGFRLSLLHKDIGICRQMAADLDAELPLVDMSLAHYGQLMADGHGDEDTSALIRQKRRLFRRRSPATGRGAAKG